MSFVPVWAATPADAKPTCMKPEWLPIVDASFEQPNGPATELLARQACPGCPVREACFMAAMAGGEHGTWAGTIRKTRAKGRNWHSAKNIREVHRRGSASLDLAG